MKYVSREVLKEKYNKKVSYIMRSVDSTRGRKLDAVPELFMCDLWRKHSHLENISPSTSVLRSQLSCHPSPVLIRHQVLMQWASLRTQCQEAHFHRTAKISWLERITQNSLNILIQIETTQENNHKIKWNSRQNTTNVILAEMGSG